ncbi:MAG: hypothetical protein EOO99_06765 [Pedobacter sp.]|nr:MAG: hypothetical protein EOO99_06765 [Pedobacter sp.]
MKYLTSLLLLCLFMGCQSQKAEPIQTSVFLENQLGQFISQHPNWKADEDTEKKTTEKFRHRVINWSNEEEFLKDLPFKFKRLIDTTVNNTAVKLAFFETYSDSTRNSQSLLNFMQLQIKGLVSAEQSKDLIVGNTYYIDGHLFKQGKRNDIQYVELGQFKGYALGSYMFSINQINPINQAN